MLELNTSNCTPFLPKDWLTSRLDALESARVKLEEGSGLGGAYTGWVHLPRDYDKEEFARIQAAAERIRSDSQALVVIGTAALSAGARAVVGFFFPNFNLTHKGGPDIYFAGNGLSSDAMLEVIELVKDKDFSINVISKSGTTTEPAVAFRIFKALLEEKYGKEGARRRIYATTDARWAGPRAWPTRRAMRSLWCPTRWAAAIPSSPPWACCPSPAPGWISPP